MKYIASAMKALVSAIGAGLVGSILAFGSNLFFGGDEESAYLSSFYGFWIFFVVSFLVRRGKPGQGSRPPGKPTR
jgi:hypothetical protein